MNRLLLAAVFLSACSTAPNHVDAPPGPTDEVSPPPQNWSQPQQLPQAQPPQARFATPPTQAPPPATEMEAPPAPRPTAPPAHAEKKGKADAGAGNDGYATGGALGGAPAAADSARSSTQGAPMRQEPSMQPQRMPPPVQQERPGLATSWGESRYSAVQETQFERASSAPTLTASLWYNDRTGAENMARYASGYAQMDRATIWLARGVSVSLRDEYGATLPGFRANGKIFAVGDNGRRYSIVIENRSGMRFEILASVDGLDVLDGRSASYNKRGYLIDPYGHLEIEGFRQSESNVAAFRFGSVRDSYAKQTTGSDRNVGVIGIAAFAERQHLPYWSYQDIERRQQADPFPSKWAQQPSPPNDMYMVR